jgi:predicted HTH transcriptional regulator
MKPALDLNHLKDLDLLRESIDIECKLAHGKDAQGQLPKDFWPTYSAMANTDGGTILLGIGQRKSRFIVEGVPNPAAVRKQLVDLLPNRNKVSANLLSDRSIQEIELEGKMVLAIHIPRAGRKDKPVYLNGNPFGGNCFRRFDEADQAMSEEEVKLLLAEQSQESLDYRILPKFGMDDISIPTLQAYRQTHATLNPGHHWSELNNLEFLKQIRAWNRDRESGEEGLTVAGLLMFGKFQSIQDEFPNYAVDYQERPEAKTERRWIDRVWLDGSWSGNLYDFYRIVYPKLIAGLKVPFSVKGGLRDDDSPVHVALREALANTLIHSDYRLPARLLVVKRPDMFGFQNPGEMRIPLELALKGDEPDCRNRRLAHLFSFVKVGEKAGTGIPKIMSGWKNQHWKKPSLTEEREPNARTILRLQMLDLFPPGILDILKLHFGPRFNDLDEWERTALAVTLSELRLTHGRLSELTDLHPTDVSKTLRGLIAKGFLVAEGTGRGTVYRFPGVSVVTPEDVFDASSSDHLATSSVNLSPSSVNLTKQAALANGPRDENGRFISAHHHLPFVDDLALLSTTEQHRMQEIAKEPREKGKVDRQILKNAILELCVGQFVTLQSLSGLLNRSKSTLRTQYLTQMCKDQELRMAFPDKPNDSRQAYTKS